MILHDALCTASYSTPRINTIAGRTVRTTYCTAWATPTHSATPPPPTSVLLLPELTSSVRRETPGTD